MGARQLSVRGLRQEWVGGAAGALTAAGLGVAALEMAQIHPNQHLYFNFLVDRKTPERLRTRYELDYWNLVARESYEYMLRQTPAGVINLDKRHFHTSREWETRILPAADRRRFTRDLSRDPDFLLPNFLLSGGARLPNELSLPILHRFKVYNNTILLVAAPDLSRVDPALADDYRAWHRAAMAGVPVARDNGYEVYRRGRRLAWVKEPCAPGALMHPFHLALSPADAGRLPEHHRKQGYFELSARGARVDGKCLGTARLPDFALARARLGQLGRWEVEIPF